MYILFQSAIIIHHPKLKDVGKIIYDHWLNMTFIIMQLKVAP